MNLKNNENEQYKQEFTRTRGLTHDDAPVGVFEQPPVYRGRSGWGCEWRAKHDCVLLMQPPCYSKMWFQVNKQRLLFLPSLIMKNIVYWMKMKSWLLLTKPTANIILIDNCSRGSSRRRFLMCFIVIKSIISLPRERKFKGAKFKECELQISHVFKFRHTETWRE